MLNSSSIDDRFAGLADRDRSPGVDLRARVSLDQFEVLQADRGHRLDDCFGVGGQRFELLFELQVGDRGDATCLRVLLRRQRVDQAHAGAADAHLVGLDQPDASGSSTLMLYVGTNGRPLFALYARIHGHDDDQRRDRADQQRVRGQRCASAACSSRHLERVAGEEAAVFERTRAVFGRFGRGARAARS